MVNFDDEKDFIEYLIIDDDGLAGLKEGAHDSAKQACQDYVNKKRS